MNPAITITRRLVVCAFLLAAGLTATAGAAPESADPAGHWTGTIEVPGTPIAIIVDLSKGDDGAWAGTIAIPIQNIRDWKLADFNIDGATVAFKMPGIPGDPAFDGKLSEDGASLSGTFTQGGANLTFKLSRGAKPTEAAKTALAGFDEFVEAARTSWKAPGFAMAIVVDDQVIFAKGFGYRDVEQKSPVTTNTLFAIGSCTKAFTTFALGLLVDDGKLDWDTPVRKYLPTFKMQDPVASEQMTPRDLVTHRSGLPRHDLSWYNSMLPRAELLKRLPYLEPNKPFRSTWQYNNLMFVTAGVLVDEVAQQKWEDVVRTRIFGPLGMTHSNFSVLDSQKTADFAFPYEERKDEIQRMEFRDITNVGPAGSINSTIDDMTRWLLVHLNDGKLGDRQVIASNTLVEIHKSQMLTGSESLESEIVPSGYALGWGTSVYRGHPRVQHGGAIDGFTAEVCLLPRDHIGIVTLCNLNGCPLGGLMVNHALDRLLGADTKDWNGTALARKLRGVESQKAAEKKKDLVRKEGTRPAHELAEYAGDYENDGYGVAHVALQDGSLEITYNNITAPLAHWHFEVFACGAGEKDHTFEDEKLMFVTGMDGEVDALQIPLEPSVKDIVFTRRPDAQLLDATYLKKLAGEYTIEEEAVELTLQGTSLIAKLKGQPAYTLEPTRNNTFKLKGLAGFTVKFSVADDGTVSGAQFIQPNGVFEAKRKP